jgi:hypothetical protein
MCAATVSVEEHEVKIYNMVSSTLHRVVLAVATVFLAALTTLISDFHQPGPAPASHPKRANP